MSLLLLPIAFFVLLSFTLVLKKSLLVSALASLLTTVMMLVLGGQAAANNILGASVYGLLIATEIGLLVFGALLFYNYLKEGDFIKLLENTLQKFSTNNLVIVVLLAYFFGGFVEGVSGFGTPAMIFAPLLLGLRFPGYLAATLPLLANTVPVIFGAVGTPVKIGLADLPIEQVPVYAAILMLLPAIIIPIIFKRYLEADGLLPTISTASGNYYSIAIAAGVSFAFPFIFFSFLGPDFPSIAAPVIGLTIWLLFIRATHSSIAVISSTTISDFYKTFKPYLFIALLLVAGKLLLGNIRFNIEWPTVQLKKSVSLFQPGLIFIIGILLLFLASENKAKISLAGLAKNTATRLPTTFATIACLAILARLLSENMDTKELFGSGNIPSVLFFVMAIATGFIGSFMAGSATVSNLMFGTEWSTTGQQLHLYLPLLLAAQLAGAGIGNALSVQNIAMVQAVLNENELGATIIKKLWKPILLLFLLVTATTVGIALLVG